MQKNVMEITLENVFADPIPFGDKLQAMLTSHVEFIITEEQRKTGHQVLSLLAFTSTKVLILTPEELRARFSQKSLASRPVNSTTEWSLAI